MCQEFLATYIVINALDECAKRETFMSIIEIMAGQQMPSLYIILTSRKERDIEDSLKGLVDVPNIIFL